MLQCSLVPVKCTPHYRHTTLPPLHPHYTTLSYTHWHHSTPHYTALYPPTIHQQKWRDLGHHTTYRHCITPLALPLPTLPQHYHYLYHNTTLARMKEPCPHISTPHHYRCYITPHYRYTQYPPYTTVPLHSHCHYTTALHGIHQQKWRNLGHTYHHVAIDQRKCYLVSHIYRDHPFVLPSNSHCVWCMCSSEV